MASRSHAFAPRSAAKVVTDILDDLDAAEVRSTIGVALGSDIQAFDVVLEDLSALSVVADNEFIVGTGAGTYGHESGATARTSMGVAIGSDIQAFDAVLEDIAALSAVADNEFIVGTGAGTYAHESGATARTSLGLAIGTNVQAWDTQLDDIAALALTDGNVIVGDGTNWVAESGATLRTSLGLGTGDSPEFAGVTISTADNATGIMIFKTPSDAVGAAVAWEHDNDVMKVGTRNAGAALELHVDDAAVAMTLLSNKDIRLSAGTSALATTATGGFPGMPTCAGVPTGVPANESAGFAPFIFDTTNDDFYIYDPVANDWLKVGLLT